jgi:hypothetical protein
MKWYNSNLIHFNYPSIRRAVSLSLLQYKLLYWQKRDEQNIKDILIVKNIFFLKKKLKI